MQEIPQLKALAGCEKRGRANVYMYALICAGLVTMTAPLAWAQASLINDAQQLLAAGNAKQAFTNLAGAQNIPQNLNNPEFNYLLGVAALDSLKYDEAIVAFERVLAVRRNHAGALLDLGRAYFHAGSFDLSETTLLSLKRANPPEAARATIDRYLAAIREKRTQTTKKFSLWGEAQLGYDTNVTGVPVDFTSAVLSAFNLAGVSPTGNAIKRRAPFLGGAVGADYLQPISAEWAAQLGAEARGRGYQKETLFNSLNGDLRAALNWTREQNRIVLNASGSAFKQKADAPGDPKPTNDRNSASLGAEYRYAITPKNQLSAGFTSLRVRFNDNPVEDFNANQVSAGWLKQFDGRGSPLIQLSTYFSRDKANNKLADGVSDKSKRVAGFRTYAQTNMTENLNLFAVVGYTGRNDAKAFARATEVEFGRDRLADISLGANWRFSPACNLHAQWQGSRNNSNIAIYDYTRHEVSSAIRCDAQ